jgi:hypothetical protein
MALIPFSDSPRLLLAWDQARFAGAARCMVTSCTLLASTVLAAALKFAASDAVAWGKGPDAMSTGAGALCTGITGLGKGTTGGTGWITSALVGYCSFNKAESNEVSHPKFNLTRVLACVHPLFCTWK